MNCRICLTTRCCPEHCCDWDTCNCRDCENCGGNAINDSSPRSTLSTATSRIIDDEPLTIPVPREVAGRTIHDEIRERVEQRMKEQREIEAKERIEYDEKRKIEKARHEEILASSRATIEKNKQVLESTQGTLDRLHKVIDGIKDTEKKFKDFQDAFGRIMTSGLEKCFGVEESVDELIQKHGAPKESSIEEVAQILASASSIGIITGAGVSAESGVFTYKDNDETWDIDGTPMKLQEVMNISILEGHPLEFWQNIQYNRVRFASTTPNGVHYALSDLMHFGRAVGKKLTLVTQNIDGFDKGILGNDPDFFEIHGNTHEMRCMFECCDTIFPCPDLSEMLYTIPLCPICSAISRPNVLLYGEGYTEKYYRADTAKEAIKESEVLVVIGTQIKCGFPQQCVKDFAKAGKKIIEINVEPVIGYGDVYVMPRTCGEVFPQIVEVTRSLF